jgi:hypothetical protein
VAIDGVIQVSNKGDAELQNQIDFMAQEINHLIPIKTQASWVVTPSYSNPGGFKFGSTTRYGPWDDDIDAVYFNRIDNSGVDQSEVLDDIEVGDKFEIFISKDNYCLFEVNKKSFSYDKYLKVFVAPIKYEGEGYDMYDLLEVQFFESANKESPRTIREEMAGHYLYSIAKIADQITVHTLHEHPGKFLCLDGDGLVMDNQFGNIKTIHFAPEDANGNRPPCANDPYDSLKKKCWEVSTRVVSNGVTMPSFQYYPKTWDKCFTVGSVYNQGAVNIPTIKFHPDDSVVYKYEQMGDDQWWRWPV